METKLPSQFPQVPEEDLTQLFNILPLSLRDYLAEHPDRRSLIEIVLDYGYHPVLRFFESEQRLTSFEKISAEDINALVAELPRFNLDNRVGIERTLHRISAIRTRSGEVVGLTCRIGRAVMGSLEMINDIVESGKSILLLGPPGVGKTTKLREAARIMSTDLGRRVMVVDTSNEIGGEGKVPHPGIGFARRMQVPSPDRQHQVMIEAVENHMPQVVIVDEIGTEAEAQAARTIAERGIQLLATAHGHTLENLIKNPTLSDLIGGIQSVILGDDEARLRGTQKTVLERRAMPTFDVIIELKELDVVSIYSDTKKSVDAYLRGHRFMPELRRRTQNRIAVQPEILPPTNPIPSEKPELESVSDAALTVFPFGINRDKLFEASQVLEVPVRISDAISQADIILTNKSQLKTKSKITQILQGRRIPIHVVKRNATAHFITFLKDYFNLDESIESQEAECEREIRELCKRVKLEKKMLEAGPQNAYLRQIQHKIAEEFGVSSMSVGEEPNRRVRIYPR